MDIGGRPELFEEIVVGNVLKILDVLDRRLFEERFGVRRDFVSKIFRFHLIPRVPDHRIL